MKSWIAPLVGIIALMFTAGVVWGLLAPASPDSAQAGVLSAPLGAKPVYNWWVCEDLGLGTIPGVNGARQRFRLCHHQDWEVLAYCTQPGLPAPAINDRCTRISRNTYQCGSGIQILREYDILDTPAPTPTETGTPGPTATGTPIATNTPTVTPTPTFTPTSQPPASTATPTQTNVRPRIRPGGLGVLQSLFPFLMGSQQPATPTPFLPLPITPTPVMPLHVTEASPLPAAPLDFYGIDFGNSQRRVQIRILPNDKRVNNGKPIILSFIPGKKCVFGDGHACVAGYQLDGAASVTFLSVHSGIGGQAEAFRNAVEGTGLDHAAFSLKRVQANLNALAGADVVIIQGKKRYRGFTLAVAGRVPPSGLKDYFGTPVEAALAQASLSAPSLSSYLSLGQPLLVFETCGWYIPGEARARGATDTSASVYLGVIVRSP